MAIQASINFRGLAIPAGYIRIERFVSTSKTSFRGHVEVYADAAAAAAIPREPLESSIINFEYDFNSPVSLHGQAYAAMGVVIEKRPSDYRIADKASVKAV